MWINGYGSSLFSAESKESGKDPEGYLVLTPQKDWEKSISPKKEYL